MPCLPALAWAALILGIWASPLAAQSPDERVMLVAWEDTLEHLANTTTITRFEPLAKAGSGGAAGGVRFALYQLRAGLLRHHRGDLELALTNLDGIASRRAKWPWPSYGLALGFVEMARARMPVLESGGQKPGESHVEAAWRNLAESFKNDPEFEPARELALRLLVPEGDRELRGDERAVLKALLKREHPEADALLVWARHLRSQRKYDSALVVLGRAITAGGDRSRLALERARTLRALGDADHGSAAYWDGVDQLTPTGREAYRLDLAWILDPDSLPLFDRTPLDSVPAWLHRFWDGRDAAAANHPGERLEEHLRRWVYAFEHFRVFNPWRLTMYSRVEYAFEGLDQCIGNDSSLYRLLAREQPSYPTDLRVREPLLDHRGLIYLRHGTPFRTAAGPTHALEVDFEQEIVPQAVGAGAAVPTQAPDDLFEQECIVNPRKGGVVLTMGPNDSWLYWFEGGWRLINFRASCALGLHSPTTLTGYLPVTAGASLGTYLARADVLPEYAATARRIQLHQWGRQPSPISCRPQMLAVISKSREDAHIATHIDTDTPPIIRAWNSIVQMFALGHAREGTGMALVSFALSGPQLRADTAADGHVGYPIAFRIVAFDHASGQTITIDTVRRFTGNQALLAGQSIAAIFELPLGAGTWQVAVRANQGDDSSGVYSMKRDLRVDGGNEFSLSDIVIGRDGAPPWHATDGLPFPLNALGTYPAGGIAELYYEVHGLKAGDAYRTTVVVRSPTAGARDGIRILSTDHANGLVTHVRKSLGLQQLKPGLYRLIITVSANGRQATREQLLLVASK